MAVSNLGVCLAATKALKNGVNGILRKNKASQKNWKENNPEKYRQTRHRSDLRKYGITPEELRAIKIAQGGQCSICKRTEEEAGIFHVDHCHVTGKNRSLLCSNCNTGLGLFKDNAALLVKAAGYIVNHKTANSKND